MPKNPHSTRWVMSIVLIAIVFSAQGPVIQVPGPRGDEPTPTSSKAAPMPQNPKAVFLTFDDGPHPKYTPSILDALARYGAKATFFVLGQNVQRYPKLVQAEIGAGHAVGNHTYSHRRLSNIGADLFADEVLRTQTLIGDGAAPCLRPPEGVIGPNTRAYAARLGLQVVMWDVDPRDWSRPGAATIASHVLQRVKPGSIVLFHDGGGDRSQTVTAIETVLSKLSSQGYAFEIVPQCRR